MKGMHLCAIGAIVTINSNSRVVSVPTVENQVILQRFVVLLEIQPNRELNYLFNSKHKLHDLTILLARALIAET